jgi:hypothetical protein
MATNTIQWLFQIIGNGDKKTWPLSYKGLFQNLEWEALCGGPQL